MLEEQKQNFRIDFEKAMAKLEVKYGITISLKNINCKGPSPVSELTTNNSMVDMDKLKKYYLLYCDEYNFSKNLYGKEGEINGIEYKLVGIDPDGGKYPIIFEKISDEEIYNFTVEESKEILGIK